MIELLLIGGAVATIWFWEYVVHLFSTTIIPLIKKWWNVQAGDMLAKLIGFLDGKIVPTKALLKKAWTYFKTNILKMDTEYVKVDANKSKRKTTTIIKNSEGQPVRTITEEEISWSDLPQEIREQMITEDTDKGTVDEKKQITNKMEERCEEECIEIMV